MDLFRMQSGSTSPRSTLSLLEKEGVAVALDNVVIVRGTADQFAGDKMSCDKFDAITYKTTIFEPRNVTSRFGMAVAFQKAINENKAFFIGGAVLEEPPSSSVDIVHILANDPSTIQ
jgi:hypothetical protein